MAKNKSVGSLDTNILLRYLIGDITSQSEAIDTLLRAGYCYDISDVVVAETIFVLEKVYGYERTLVTENVRAIMAHAQFNCNRELFTQVLPLYESEQTLSIIDCLALWYARLQKATPLYTFDKTLIKKSAGDACTP